MSALDDVRADLANHAGLTRPQMEQVLTLLNRKTAGIAVTVTLRSMLPAAGRRLASASAPERAEYLRVLRDAIRVALTRQRSAWVHPQPR